MGGAQWGDRGDGYIGYEAFEATWVEGWVAHFPEDWFQDWPGGKTLGDSGLGVIERAWGVPEHGGGVFHCREFADTDDERIGWAFAVEREGRIEVEELFVRPQFRRKGHGTKLIQLMRKLAVDQAASLKVWISFADIAPENLRIIEKLTQPLGLSLKPSGVRWAAFVASAEGEAPTRGQRDHLLPGLRPRAPFLRPGH